MKSPLVNYTKLSPNNSGKRTHAIDRITPHCVVGQASVETLGALFSRERQASSNYGIGSDGRIGLYVDEDCRSWCSSSAANDQRAVTIECASDASEPYAFRPVVYDKLVDLCVDICERNGKTKLIWINDKAEALAYNPAPGEMLLTVHRWFSPKKSCPGEWLWSRMGDLAMTVTERLNPMDQPSDWATDACNKAVNKRIVSGYGGGKYGWKDPVTREQLCVILDRLGLM